MKKRITWVLLWCLLIAAGLHAAGCNTIRGAGRDIEEAGEAIQDAAQ